MYIINYRIGAAPLPKEEHLSGYSLIITIHSSLWPGTGCWFMRYELADIAAIPELFILGCKVLIRRAEEGPP